MKLWRLIQTDWLPCNARVSRKMSAVCGRNSCAQTHELIVGDGASPVYAAEPRRACDGQRERLSVGEGRGEAREACTQTDEKTKKPGHFLFVGEHILKAKLASGRPPLSFTLLYYLVDAAEATAKHTLANIVHVADVFLL